jgi:hypothetical protein
MAAVYQFINNSVSHRPWNILAHELVSAVVQLKLQYSESTEVDPPSRPPNKAVTAVHTTEILSSGAPECLGLKI